LQSTNYHKILIIQTAFIGDVILATPIIEALYNNYNGSKIDFLIRKGNEGLLKNHPKLNRLLIWDKRGNKLRNQVKLIKEIRSEKYDVVINLQRFLSSGIFTIFSNAKIKIGFNKNPLSSRFTFSIPHIIKEGVHEVDRNLSLLSPLMDSTNERMQLYPSKENYKTVEKYKDGKYIIIAPTSVWFTKQYPIKKWIEFIKNIDNNYNIYLIGGPDDRVEIDKIINTISKGNCINLCGKLNLLESTALMENASMCYVNDSAPMHLASAVNANVTAVFCSTVTDFGFGPKSDNSYVVESTKELKCRPCGLHGKKECPEGHFDCANNINTKQLLFTLNDDGRRN